MRDRIKDEIIDVRIRIFRAVDDLQSSLKYIEGHRKVLHDHGFSHLTTNNEVWYTNSNVYCFIAEMNDETQEAVGGIRIELLCDNFLLPLEEALGKRNPEVLSMIRNNTNLKTAEMCGLWNSKKVAGRKLSLILGRTAVAMAPLLGVQNLYIFIAKYTMEYSKRLGFRIVSSIGSNGNFKYPNDFFIANVLLNQDLLNLNIAKRQDRDRIQHIRNNLNSEFLESEEDVQILIRYMLAPRPNILPQ